MAWDTHITWRIRSLACSRTQLPLILSWITTTTTMPPIHKVLIANRGEIAVRIMHTCRSMGLRTVAVFSDADATALHVASADEAVHIGASPASESYLRIDAIIEAAKRTQADAIHPGYGFLSENAEFSQRCRDEGIVFIGPAPDTIAAMGSKVRRDTRAALSRNDPMTHRSIDRRSASQDPCQAIAARARGGSHPRDSGLQRRRPIDRDLDDQGARGRLPGLVEGIGRWRW